MSSLRRRIQLSLRQGLRRLFGLYTLAIVIRWDLTVHSLTCVLAGAVLVAIALIDHDSWLIDDRMSAAVALIGLTGHGASLLVDAELSVGATLASVAAHLIAGAVAFGMLYGMGYLMTKALDKEALGGGDAPLLRRSYAARGCRGFSPCSCSPQLKARSGGRSCLGAEGSATARSSMTTAGNPKRVRSRWGFFWLLRARGDADR